MALGTGSLGKVASCVPTGRARRAFTVMQSRKYRLQVEGSVDGAGICVSAADVHYPVCTSPSAKYSARLCCAVGVSPPFNCKYASLPADVQYHVFHKNTGTARTPCDVPPINVYSHRCDSVGMS